MLIPLNNNLILESSKLSNNPIKLDEIDAISDAIEPNINKEIVIPKDVIDSFKIKKNLNPDIWTNSTLNPKVRTNLYKIAKDFFHKLNLPANVKIKDVIFTGSLANYNWSKFSDIDLHVLIDFNQFENKEIIADYFKAKKDIWNQEHDIKMFDFPVEVYVQDTNEKLNASAVYSIINNKWILKPNPVEFKLNKEIIKDKADQLLQQLKSIKTDYNEEDYQSVIDKTTKLKSKIKQFRKAGLEKGGEFSLENIVFKTLRRTPFFDILDAFKAKAYDKSVSLNEVITEENKISNDDIMKYFYANDGFFNIDNAKQFAKKYLGYNIVKTVGIGGNGAAYLTDKNTKLKFTYNENEYIFAKRSIGKKNKYMADYYKAIEVTDGIYVIEMEFIKSLPEKTRLELKKLFDDLLNRKSDYNKQLKDKVDLIKSKVGLFANDLFNADNYGIKNGELATFDPVSENKINTQKLTKNGVVLIKGNPLEDGSQRLYAAYVKFSANFNRTKTDSTDAKPVNMVTLNPNTIINRVKIQDGKLKLVGVDFKDSHTKELALGLKSLSVGLNNNKTPLHWDTLKYSDMAQAIFKNKNQILNLNNIRWDK